MQASTNFFSKFESYPAAFHALLVSHLRTITDPQLGTFLQVDVPSSFTLIFLLLCAEVEVLGSIVCEVDVPFSVLIFFLTWDGI